MERSRGEIGLLEVDAADADGAEDEAAEEAPGGFGGEGRGGFGAEALAEIRIGQFPGGAGKGVAEAGEDGGGEDGDGLVAVGDRSGQVEVDGAQGGGDFGESAAGEIGFRVGMGGGIEPGRGGGGDGALRPEGEFPSEHFPVDLEAAADHPEERQGEEGGAGEEEQVEQDGAERAHQKNRTAILTGFTGFAGWTGEEENRSRLTQESQGALQERKRRKNEHQRILAGVFILFILQILSSCLFRNISSPPRSGPSGRRV
jgi:hypothetical protein